jgi:hypothetical protein
MSLGLVYIETREESRSYQALGSTLANATIDRLYWFGTRYFQHDLGIPVHNTMITDPSGNFNNWYNNIALNIIPNTVATDHALIIQNDGYAVNSEAWTDEFLEYDYIGAPWMHHQEHERVGNGGFSLRSRRLFKALQEIQPGFLPSDWPDHARYTVGDPDGGRSFPEDTVICVLLRPILERDFGIRFAPSELAHRFSWEQYSSDNSSPWRGRSYGFHGQQTAEIYGQKL